MGLENQANQILPPRKGSIMVLSVTTTRRSRDLSKLALGAPWTDGGHEGLFITILADGGDFFFYLSPEADTDLSKTAAEADGTGDPAFTLGACWKCADGIAQDIYIDRVTDRFLTYVGSTTMKVRIRATSSASRVR